MLLAGGFGEDEAGAVFGPVVGLEDGEIEAFGIDFEEEEGVGERVGFVVEEGGDGEGGDEGFAEEFGAHVRVGTLDAGFGFFSGAGGEDVVVEAVEGGEAGIGGNGGADEMVFGSDVFVEGGEFDIGFDADAAHAGAVEAVGVGALHGEVGADIEVESGEGKGASGLKEDVVFRVFGPGLVGAPGFAAEEGVDAGEEHLEAAGPGVAHDGGAEGLFEGPDAHEAGGEEKVFCEVGKGCFLGA